VTGALDLVLSISDLHGHRFAAGWCSICAGSSVL